MLFVSMHDDEDYLMEVLSSGGDGYVLKDAQAPQLLSAMREVMSGGSFLSPRMLNHLM